MNYSVVVNGEEVSSYFTMRRAKSDFELIRKILPDAVVCINISEISISEIK